MKKKFINGLLLVALFVGFTGSMVSCKDYDDEKLGAVRGDLSNLKDALEAQKKALQDQIDGLQNQLNTCKQTCADFRALVEKTYLSISEFNTFKDNLGNIYYTKSEVDDKLKNGYYTKAEIDEMFGKLDFYTKSEIDAKLEELKSYVDAEAIAKTIADLLAAENKTLTDALNKYFVNNSVINDYLLGLIKDNSVNEEYVKAYVANALIDVNNAISEAKATANEALQLAQTNKDEIAGLKTIITSLEASVKTLGDNLISLGADLDKVRETAEAAKAKADANSLLIANLEEGYEYLEDCLIDLQDEVFDLEADVFALNGELIAVKNEIAAMKEQAEADKLAADALHREMLETISGIVSSLEKLGASIDNVNDNIDVINGQIDDINGEIDFIYDIFGEVYYYLSDLYDSVGTLEDLTAILEDADVDELLKNARKVLDSIQDVQILFNKMLTGIEVNGTDNPMFGSFALPVDVRSNVLVAFYGQTDSYGIQFPTNRPGYYANGESGITDEDIEMIGSLNKVDGYINKAGERTIIAKDGAEGNAGTLYLTVNPTNRDFTGTEFELINSQNVTSAIQLSGLAKSEKVLTFGYTRGGVTEQSPNGFYEAKATLSQADINNVEHAGVDFNTLKGIAENIRNYKNGISVSSLISDIYNSMTEICEAKAVKGTWTDNDGKAYSVVSQYAIAATAIRPLSFAFAKDVTYEQVPGVGLIEDIADRFIDELVSQFPYLSQYEVRNVELKALDLATLEVEITATVTKGDVTKTVDVKGHLSRFVDNVEGITLKNVVDLMDALNDFFNEYNTISIDALASKVTKSLTAFFDDLNNRYGHYFNPNKFLQPVLLVKANGNYARLSASAKYPAHVDKATLALLPTSYNAEIIAPAYKKFLAVTNVSKDGVSAKGGDAACKTILDEANKQENFMKVIETGFDFIEFKAKAGYTYEILYSAVDYDGKVTAKKFYVKVNE